MSVCRDRLLTCALAAQIFDLQRVYACLPRLLVHTNRSPLTIKRTLLVQRSCPFVQLARMRQSFSVHLCSLKTQEVSPARAPRSLMIADRTPSRAFRAEQDPVSGAQTPTIAGG